MTHPKKKKKALCVILPTKISGILNLNLEVSEDVKHLYNRSNTWHPMPQNEILNSMKLKKKKMIPWKA